MFLQRKAPKVTSEVNILRVPLVSSSYLVGFRRASVSGEDHHLEVGAPAAGGPGLIRLSSPPAEQTYG